MTRIPLPDSDETWRPVVGYEGFYEVSDLGRVRSVDRIVHYTWRGRALMRAAYGKIRHLSSDTDGYLIVGILNRTYTVHQLVLKAFVGPKPDGLECLHDDSNRKNNRLSNLKWGTPAENGDDRIRHGLLRGELNGSAKLTEAQIPIIRARNGKNASIAREFSVSRQTITKIKMRALWRHVE